MKLTYPAVFYKGEGGYAVEVPDIPGCVSGGAIIMGTDAASGWVLTELEDGKPILFLCAAIIAISHCS
jgi:predicted RNase H-like HicB family nuclease